MNYQSITLYESSKDSENRLSKVKTTQFTASEHGYGHQVFVINPKRKYQNMVGIGGAFTESAGYVLSQVSESEQEKILKNYFDPELGLGYSLGRTHMNSSDFSLGNWACCEKDGDTELKSFNLDRTKKYILPMIEKAKKVKKQSFELFFSPWSPPAWMKTNGEMNNGGKLKKEYHQVWANYYLRFIQELEKEGHPVWGLTIQNEPAATQIWDSCLYTAEEERDFVKNHLGPTLEKAGYSHIKIIVWDHNREVAFDRGDVVYSDPEASKYVWGVGLHWYSGDHFEQLQQLTEAYPEKNIIFTEGCWEGGVKLGQWDRGERYAHHMIGDFNHHASAWCDWNMILDHTGGPNHVDNLCDAPVIINTESKEVHYQSSFYYIGHFSKFIRPGARRLGMSYNGGPLEATVWENTDGSVALVVLNTSEKSENFRFIFGVKGGMETSIPARAIQTYVIQ